MNKKYCFFIIIVMSATFFQVFGQDISTEKQEVSLNSVEITLPINQGLSIALSGKNWIYDVSNTLLLAPNLSLTFVAIEHALNVSNFIFFRSTEGRDVLQFKRYDQDYDLIYTYNVEIEWVNAPVSQAKSKLFNDEYATITQLPIGEISISQQSEDTSSSLSDSNVLTEEVDTPTSSSEVLSNTSDTGTPSVADTNTEISPATLPVISSNQVEDITTVQDNNDTSALIDENTLLGIDTKVNEGSGASEQNDATSLSIEEILKDVSSLSLEEMKRCIDQYYQSVPYELLWKTLNEWIASNDNMFEQSELLWYFGGVVDAHLSTSSDILHMLDIYQVITNEYPLSYEYYDAGKKIDEIYSLYFFLFRE